MTDLPENAIEHFNTQTVTPDEAKKKLICPVGNARMIPGLRCIGDTCAFWRYLPIIASDPIFMAAVKREMEAMKAEAPTGAIRSETHLHKAAVARVAEDPSAYCIPSHHKRGYCGGGGKP